jgi:type IV fimbrial biogenesis protein FimT
MDRGLAQHLLGGAKGRPVLTGQRGVTIVEVPIAIAIVGLLMALAAPSATTWIQNNQIRSAADSILNGIQTARIEALKRNTAVSFQLTDAASTAWRVCIYDAAADDCSGTQPIIMSKGASEGTPNGKVGVESVFTDTDNVLNPGDGMPAAVTFDSFGRVAPAAPVNIARVDVRNPTLASGDERRLEIVVTVGGQTYMCDPKLSKATNPQGCK